MNIEKISILEQLSGEQKELAEIVGIDAYQKLVQNYGGSSIYINKFETIAISERNAEIFENFTVKMFRHKISVMNRKNVDLNFRNLVFVHVIFHIFSLILNFFNLGTFKLLKI